MKKSVLLTKSVNYYRIIKRKRWLRYLRKKNHNHDFSLITNNCIGGVICHDLGEQFRSPTVNLWIPNDIFLAFAQNLKYYLECEIEEIPDETKSYPVGRIVPKDNQHIPIVVYFQHYASFGEAYAKWKERSRRVNYKRLYFIWDYGDTEITEPLVAFDRWNVRKLLILHEPIKGIQHSDIISCYRQDPYNGKIFNVINQTGKRYLDEIDYIGFLNREG